MTKRNNAIRLADRYEMSDLEPGVDPGKVTEFLTGDSASSDEENPPKSKHPSKPAENDTGIKKSATPSIPASQSTKTEPWTSRTIRLRQSTATHLTQAACAQKSKEAEGKLQPGEPNTVQEIADYGIRLALAELGYDK